MILAVERNGVIITMKLAGKLFLYWLQRYCIENFCHLLIFQILFFVKKIQPLLLTLFVLLGCNTSKNSLFITDSGEILKLRNPPGTIQIGENLFVDKMEIPNISYREYLYWIVRIYGEESTTYQKALPDTMVWDSKDEQYFIEAYFRHPYYNPFPIVGLSYSQATSFCSWRADRVYESILFKKKIISSEITQDSTNYFSISRYLSGGYGDFLPNKNIPYPEYRLPTVEEWEFLASGGLDIEQYPHGYDELSKSWKKVTKNGYEVYSIKREGEKKEESLHFYGGIQDKNSDSGIGNPNNFGLLHTIGNVAEMTAEKGIAKGGSWCHSLEESKIEANILYDKPTKWLGFRCVCSWKNPE